MIEQIWVEFHQILLRFIASKVKDLNIAEDILQDVFIQVVKKINSLEDKEKLRAWLYQICRNRIIDHYRTKKIDMVSIDLCDNLEAEEIYEESLELNACVRILISDLPTSVSSILEASELNNIKQKEIATNENISLSAVKSRLRRGRALLKQKLLACCPAKFTGQRADELCRRECGCQS